MAFIEQVLLCLVDGNPETDDLPVAESNSEWPVIQKTMTLSGVPLESALGLPKGMLDAPIRN